MCDYNFGAVDVVSFVVAAISLVESTKDIYSWGVCEYGSEGVRCFPGRFLLAFCSRCAGALHSLMLVLSLDLVVDLVDGGVVGLVVGAEGWVRRLSPWGGQSRMSCAVFGDLLGF